MSIKTWKKNFWNGKRIFGGDMDLGLVSVVLPSLISLVVILFFRKMDRDRFHVSRVKKLSDAILAKVSDQMDLQESHLRSRVLELSELTDNAQVLRSHLQEQLKTIDQKANQLESMEGILPRLDEKLKHISQWENNVDGRLRFLQSQEEKISGIQENLEVVRRSFSQMSTKVTEVEQSLLNEFLNKVHELESSTEKNMVQWVENLESKVSHRIEDRIGSLDKNFNQMDRAQKQKQMEYQEKYEWIEKHIDSIERNLNKTQERVLDQTKQKYEEFLGKIERVQKENHNQVEFLEDRIQQVENEYKLSLDRHIHVVDERIHSFDEFFVRMDQDTQDLERKLLDRIQNKIQSIEEATESKLKSFLQRVESSQEQLKAFLEQAKQSTTEVIHRFKQKIEDQKKDYQIRVEDMEASLQQFQSSLENRFTEEIQRLLHSIEDERRKAVKHGQNTSLYFDRFLDSEKQRIGEEFERFSSQNSNQHKELERGMALLQKEQASFQNLFETVRDTARKEMQDLQNSFQKHMELEKKNAYQVYEALERNIQNLQSQTQEMVRLDAESLSHLILEKKNELDLFCDRSKTLVEKKNKDLDSLVLGMKGMYNKELSELLKEFRVQHENTQKEYLTDHGRLIQTTEKQIQNLSERFYELRKNFDFLSERSLKDLEDQILLYKENFDMMVSEWKGQMQNQEHRIFEEIEERSKQFQSKAAEMSLEMSQNKEVAIRGLHKEMSEIQLSMGRLEQKYMGVFEEKLSEFNSRSSEFSERLNQMKSSGMKALEQTLLIFRDRVEKLSQELESKLSIKVDKSSTHLKMSIEVMESELNGRVKSYIEKTELKLMQLNAEIKRIQDYDLSIAEFNERFDRELERVNEELMQFQDRLGKESQEEYKKINKELLIIDQRIEEFTRDSRVFKKADRFYDRLREEISEAKIQMKRMEQEKSSLQEFQKKVQNLFREREWLNKEIAQFEDRKKEMIYISEKIGESKSLSGQLEKRVEVVQKDLEIVNEQKSQLNDLKQIYYDLSQRLEQEKEVKDSMEKSVQSLKDSKKVVMDLGGKLSFFTQELKEFESKQFQLKEGIKGLEKRVSMTDKLKGQLEEFLGKFQQMDSFALDVQKRTEQLEVARKRLGEVEIKWEEIETSARERIIELSRLLENTESGRLLTEESKREITKDGGEEEGLLETLQKSTLSEENRQKAVVELREKGLDIDRISHLLNLSKSEVKLITDLSQAQKSNGKT